MITLIVLSTFCNMHLMHSVFFVLNHVMHFVYGLFSFGSLLVYQCKLGFEGMQYNILANLTLILYKIFNAWFKVLVIIYFLKIRVNV